MPVYPAHANNVPLNSSIHAMHADMVPGMISGSIHTHAAVPALAPTAATYTEHIDDNPINGPAVEQSVLDSFFQKPEQIRLRSLLNSIRSSQWYLLNQLEPISADNQSILSQFTHTPARGARIQCLFDGCTKNFDRMDRAVGHVRVHIGLQPFPCPGGCRIIGW
jgi:hypothetical protein